MPAQKKPRNAAPAAPAGIPSIDAIGPDGRAHVVRRMLAPYQEMRVELDIMQLANKLGDGDLIPGFPADGENGVPSFRKRREQILQLEQDILASVEPRIIERLREMVGE